MTATTQASKTLAPIEREKTLGETAYDRLKNAIMTGAFKPDEKVTVRSIASALNVSLTPARDALSRLITEGALEAKGPKTVIVPPLNQQVLREVAKIRIALEGLAAEAATPKMADRDIDGLETIQATLNKAMDQEDYATVLAANEDFHFTIYRQSDMPRLVSIIESLWLRIGPSLNLLYPEFAIHRAGVSNHTEILKGLRRGEPETVRAAIEKDIKDGFDSLSALLAKQPD